MNKELGLDYGLESQGEHGFCGSKESFKPHEGKGMQITQ